MTDLDDEIAMRAAKIMSAGGHPVVVIRKGPQGETLEVHDRKDLPPGGEFCRPLDGASPRCSRCGWYKSYPSHNCYPRRGRLASSLGEAVPDVPSTKHGYGDGMFTFEHSKDMHTRFEVDDRSVRLADLYLLGSLSVEEAAALVRLLEEWRKGLNR